jgi:outer membrane murein-binding lipoprotein Lpp
MTLDYEAIKRRCEAASPGPWESEHLSRKGFWLGVKRSGFAHSSDRRPIIISYLGQQFAYRSDDFQIQEAICNAEFIAHARTDIPDLLAAVEALQAENKRMRDEIDAALDHLDMGEEASAAARLRRALSTPPRQEKPCCDVCPEAHRANCDEPCPKCQPAPQSPDSKEKS